MIETTITEINVNELMQRIRALVAHRHTSAKGDRNGYGGNIALPGVPRFGALPQLIPPSRVDPKTGRLETMIERARAKTAVSKRIPKLFRRLFRKQGGYNELLLESIRILIQTNAKLNTSLDQLSAGFATHNQSLHELGAAHDISRAWMKAAATSISSLSNDLQASAALRKELTEQIGAIDLKTTAADNELPILRSQSERMGEHLRNAQSQLDHTVENLATLARQAENLGAQVNSLHNEHNIASENSRVLRTDFDHACEHLRNLQREVDIASENSRVLRTDFDHACEHLRNLQREVDRKTEIEPEFQALRSQSERMAEHLRNLQSQLDGAIENFYGWERQAEHLRNLQTEADRTAAALKDLREQIESRAPQVRHLEQQSGAWIAEREAIRHSVESLEQRQTSDAGFIKAELSRHAALLHSRLLATAPINRKDRSAAAQKGIDSTPADHQLDAFYFTFEDRFRGTRQEIKKRVRFYLPILRNAGVGTKARPIVDLGCGRGEWLELLLENKLHGSGVDINEVMVAQCKQRRLKVVLEDAIEFLRSLPDRSQGGVTGFHIIEHLPLSILMELLRQSRRVLKPGGLAIFETPNCKNLMVGACNFNIDPTHRNPVYPETAQFMLETWGFERVRLEYLQPVDTSSIQNIEEQPARLRELLYGPQDFAVIGYTPTAE